MNFCTFTLKMESLIKHDNILPEHSKVFNITTYSSSDLKCFIGISKIILRIYAVVPLTGR